MKEGQTLPSCLLQLLSLTPQGQQWGPREGQSRWPHVDGLTGMVPLLGRAPGGQDKTGPVGNLSQVPEEKDGGLALSLCPEGTVTPASPDLLLISTQLGGPGGQSLALTAACKSLPVHSSTLPLTALQGQGVHGVSAAPSTAGHSAKEGPDFACALFFQGIPSLDIRRD